MQPIFKTFHPDGFRTVNTYIFAEDAQGLIQFFKDAFYAEEKDMTINDKTGDVLNCILKIGDSCIMIAQARGEFMGMRSSFYLFVEDVDEMYSRALEYGAHSVFPAADMPYDDRQAGVIDPAGNYWWLSKRLVEADY